MSDWIIFLFFCFVAFVTQFHVRRPQPTVTRASLLSQCNKCCLSVLLCVFMVFPLNHLWIHVFVSCVNPVVDFFVLIRVLHADFKSIQTGHAFQPTTFILLAPVLNTHLWVSVGSRVFRQFLSAFTAKCTLKGRIHPKTHLLTMMMMMMFDTWQGQFFIPSVIWWSV